MRRASVILLSLVASVADLRAQQPADADPAARADRLFASGKLKEAAAAYRAAIAADRGEVESPGPSTAARLHRNRFLLACVLFETGSLEEAGNEFASLHEANSQARAARFLARLCGRRLKHPGESIADAVKAEIVSVLRAEEPPGISWNDPVIEGLMGEAFLRTGPMFISPRSVEPIVEQHSGDPEVLLGAAQFLGRSQRSNLLEFARHTFPDSAALQIAAFHSLQFTRGPAIKVKAMEALGAAILTDPENAYPRYLRIGIDHFETQRDPATNTLPPYPAKVLAELERCNGFDRFDGFAAERVAAARRILRELGHPFQLSLIQSNFESGLLLNNLLQRLTASAKAALDAGNLEEARRIRRITETMMARWTAHTGSSSVQTTTAAGASIMLAHFARYHEARGELDRVAAIRKQQNEHQARALGPASNQLWQSIAIIPIPSVSNYAVERILTGTGGKED